MPYTYKLTVTLELKEEITQRWQLEIKSDGWPAEDVARDIAKVMSVPTGTVIEWNDEDPGWNDAFDEGETGVMTPEQLIVLGWQFYGITPDVAPIETEKV
jgi:hypothetical protein